MSRARKKMERELRMVNADIILLILLGFGMGLLLAGVGWTMIATFANAGEDETYSFKSLIAGVLCIGASLGVGWVAKIYWCATKYAEFQFHCKENESGIVLAFLTMCGGTMLGISAMVCFCLN